MDQQQLFTTSVYTTYLKGLDNKDLSEIILSIRDNNESNKRSNQGGYQTYPYTAPNFDNPLVEELFTDIIAPSAQDILNSWGLNEIKIKEYCYWYNINHKYTYNSSHSHPGSHISGVYYVKVPSNSGNIIFERSESERDRMQFQSQKMIMGNMNVDNPNINTEHWFVPEEGMLLMFPGHLNHKVEQNLSDDADSDRISISFNFF